MSYTVHWQDDVLCLIPSETLPEMACSSTTLSTTSLTTQSTTHPPLSSNVYVVGKTMIDCGNPSRQGEVLTALMSGGLHPRDIEQIVLLDTHFDHVGIPDSVLYPTAQVYMSHEGIRALTTNPAGALWLDYARSWQQSRNDGSALYSSNPAEGKTGEPFFRAFRSEQVILKSMDQAYSRIPLVNGDPRVNDSLKKFSAEFNLHDLSHEHLTSRGFADFNPSEPGCPWDLDAVLQKGGYAVLNGHSEGASILVLPPKMIFVSDSFGKLGAPTSTSQHYKREALQLIRQLQASGFRVYSGHNTNDN
jgi:glyoxylase-like metal-dependent hydrolase (beta-lactamase superfamily II)